MGDDITVTLPIISVSLYRIVLIIQIILGTFGNIMNILIFTRRSLRTNPCSLYFLAASVNNIFSLYVTVLTRLLSSGWKIDPSNNNVILCKLRIFFVYTSLALIQWYIVLASVDRYLSSCQSAQRRQMSSVSIAKKAIALTTLIIAVGHFHTLVWWDVDYIGSKTYCNIFIFAYELAFQAFFLSITCLIPPVLMAIFGTLTILNVKKLRTQVGPQNNDARGERSRSKDRQLVVMLLIQVFVTIFCTLPFSTANIGLIFTQYVSPLSEYDDAIYTFFNTIARILLYCNPMVGFYIYTLFGRTFRNEMKVMFLEVMILILPRFGLEKYMPKKPRNVDATVGHTVRTVAPKRKLQLQATIVEDVG